jgi:hypothetical protein
MNVMKNFKKVGRDIPISRAEPSRGWIGNPPPPLTARLWIVYFLYSFCYCFPYTEVYQACIA